MARDEWRAKAPCANFAMEVDGADAGDESASLILPAPSPIAETMSAGAAASSTSTLAMPLAGELTLESP